MTDHPNVTKCKKTANRRMRLNIYESGKMILYGVKDKEDADSLISSLLVFFKSTLMSYS